MSFELIQAVDEVMKKGTRDFKLRVPEKEPGEYITPNFYIGAVPPRRKGNIPGRNDKEAYPFIINRMVSGEDTSGLSIIALNTVCGIYTGESWEAGEHDIINLTMRVKRLLIEQHTLKGRFVRQDSILWQIGDIDEHLPQPYPYFGGAIQTTWEAPGYEISLTSTEARETYGEIY